MRRFRFSVVKGGSQFELITLLKPPMRVALRPLTNTPEGGRGKSTTKSRRFPGPSLTASVQRAAEPLESRGPVRYHVLVASDVGQNVAGIFHRYSDWEALHVTLLTAGLQPPIPLPPKHVRRTAQALDLRAAALTAYSNALLGDRPILRSSAGRSALSGFFNVTSLGGKTSVANPARPPATQFESNLKSAFPAFKDVEFVGDVTTVDGGTDAGAAAAAARSKAARRGVPHKVDHSELATRPADPVGRLSVGSLSVPVGRLSAAQRVLWSPAPVTPTIFSPGPPSPGSPGRAARLLRLASFRRLMLSCAVALLAAAATTAGVAGYAAPLQAATPAQPTSCAVSVAEAIAAEVSVAPAGEAFLSDETSRLYARYPWARFLAGASRHLGDVKTDELPRASLLPTALHTARHVGKSVARAPASRGLVGLGRGAARELATAAAAASVLLAARVRLAARVLRARLADTSRAGAGAGHAAVRELLLRSGWRFPPPPPSAWELFFDRLVWLLHEAAAACAAPGGELNLCAPH